MGIRIRNWYMLITDFYLYLCKRIYNGNNETD